MATAGDGAASSYETGGAGGKFRKRPLRRPQTTPYDRPPTALRNPGRKSDGWLSKLVVDPASKLISSTAHYFFSTVLCKRLPPPPPPPPQPPEVNQEPWERHHEAVPIVSSNVPFHYLDKF
ncbi:unnamed protein product [Ilex paraguariensis]|uniref:Uncharacterized protein n=1 Tax=Ilex paraguariensis TaxID=185542 RepID=A0ABC8TSK6_9AQUA